MASIPGPVNCGFWLWDTFVYDDPLTCPQEDLLKGFANPAGYQTNMMVYEPGGYQFIDFAKVGIPVRVIAAAVAIILTPIVYPF